jgi:RNA polymerase sigma-70 factor (ECF subfamily)
MADRKRFVAFLARRVGSGDIAEEILQTAFLKTIEKGALIQDHDRAVPWFYQLLRNAVVDHYRRLGAQARALKAIARSQGPERGSDQGLENAVCECVKGVVKTLKPEYAEVLRRMDLEEVSIAEFAEEAGITLNNAGVRLHRARVALRKRLGEFCGACTEHSCLSCTCRDRRRVHSDHDRSSIHRERP